VLILLKIKILLTNQSSLLLSSKQMKNVKVTVNIYKEPSMQKSIVSCESTISQESKTCEDIGNQSVSPIQIKVENSESPSNSIAEEAKMNNEKETLASKMTQSKRREQEEKDRVSGLGSIAKEIQKGFRHAGDLVSGAFQSVEKVFRFRFNSSEEAKTILKRQDEKDADEDQSSDKTPGDAETIPGVARNKYEKCNDEIKRLAHSGIIDIRYIKGCNIDVQGKGKDTAMNFTAISRETEQHREKYIQFIFDENTGHKFDIVKNFAESLKKSCKENKQAVKKIKTELSNKFCEKENKKVQLSNCTLIAADAWKEKCSNIQIDLKKAKAQLDSIEKELIKEEKEINGCRDKKNDIKDEAKKHISNTGEEKDKKEGLQKKKGDLNKQKDNMEKAVQDSQQTVNKAKKKSEEVGSEGENIKKDQTESEKVNAARNSENKGKQQKNNALGKSASQKKQEIIDLEQQNTQLREKISGTGKELKKNAKDNQESRRKIDENSAKATEAEQNISGLQDEIAEGEKKANNLNTNSKKKNQKSTKGTDPSINSGVSTTINAAKASLDSLKKNCPQSYKAKLDEIISSGLQGKTEALGELDNIIKNS